MGYYPVFLEMKQRRCIVIGGGAVAERKVGGLLAVGACVTVISPTITERLQNLLTQGAIRHVAREYEAGDLAAYELAFVATDNVDTNRVVFHEARSRKVWVNSADDPDRCDFILPAVIRRGDLMIAVSTGGGSPAVSRAIREELESYFTKDYEILVGMAAEVREELRQRSIVPDYQTWRKALSGDLRQLIMGGELGRAKSLLLKQLGTTSCE